MGFLWTETYNDAKKEFIKLCRLLQKRQLEKYPRSDGLDVYFEQDILEKTMNVIKHIKKALNGEINEKKKKILNDLLEGLNKVVNKKERLNFGWAYIMKSRL